MDADCVVDAFPGEIFHGMVSQVRFSPNNVSGVVTYSAVVEVDNPEEKLRPGMTATITVHTHEAHGVAAHPERGAALPADAADWARTASRSRSRPSPPLAEGPGARLGAHRATSPATRRTRCASSPSASPTASSPR